MSNLAPLRFTDVFLASIGWKKARTKTEQVPQTAALIAQVNALTDAIDANLPAPGGVIEGTAVETSPVENLKGATYFSQPMPEIPKVFVRGLDRLDASTGSLKEAAIEVAQHAQQLRSVLADPDFRSSEYSFRNLIANMSDGVIIMRETGEVLLFNPAAETLLGWSSVEVINHHIRFLLSDVAEDLPRLMHTNKVAHPDPIQMILRCRNGRALMTELTVSWVVMNNNPVYVVLFRDVTERTSMLEQIRVMSETLKQHVSALDFLELAILIADPTRPYYPIVYASKMAEVFFDKDYDAAAKRVAGRSSLDGKSMIDLITSLDGDTKEFLHSVRNGIDGIHYIKMADGRWFFVRVNAALAHDGRISHMVVSFSDATNIMSAREDIDAQNAFFLEILNRVPMAVEIVDPATEGVVYANQEAAKLYGVRHPELVGQKIPDLISPKQMDAWRTCVTRVLCDGEDAAIRPVDVTSPRSPYFGSQFFLSHSRLMHKQKAFILSVGQNMECSPGIGQAMHDLVLDALPLGITISRLLPGRAPEVVFVNSVMETLGGVSRLDLVGRFESEIFDVDIYNAFIEDYTSLSTADHMRFALYPVIRFTERGTLGPMLIGRSRVVIDNVPHVINYVQTLSSGRFVADLVIQMSVLFRNTMDLVVTYGPDGTMTYISSTAKRRYLKQVEPSWGESLEAVILGVASGSVERTVTMDAIAVCDPLDAEAVSRVAVIRTDKTPR